MAEQKTVLQVTGMTCGGCENAVRRALSQIDGIREVTASHSQNSVGITYDAAKVNLDAVKSRIQALGYQVG